MTLHFITRKNAAGEFTPTGETFDDEDGGPVADYIARIHARDGFEYRAEVFTLLEDIAADYSAKLGRRVTARQVERLFQKDAAENIDRIRAAGAQK